MGFFSKPAVKGDSGHDQLFEKEEKTEQAFHKADLKRIEKNFKGTNILKKCDMKMTAKAIIKPKTCSWEIVERSSSVAGLRPLSHSAALLDAAIEGRASSRCGSSLSCQTYVLAPNFSESQVSVISPARSQENICETLSQSQSQSRSQSKSQSISELTCKSRSQSHSDSRCQSRVESRAAGHEYAYIQPRCRLPKSTREEMLEKMEKKAQLAAEAKLTSEAKRMKKVKDQKHHHEEVREFGQLMRYVEADGERRQAEIDMLKVAISEKRTSFADTDDDNQSAPRSDTETLIQADD